MQAVIETQPLPRAPAARTLPILGVPIANVDREEALALLERMLVRSWRAHAVYFANAHTLNLASADAAYRETLRAADVVFGDGTGVRWAARWLHGVEMADNVNGTDFVPLMLGRWADRGLRYFMLGAQPDIIRRAAAHARTAFPGCTLAGWHHGFVPPDARGVVDVINAARPHVLLVGMGNPLQERWIEANLSRLEVPLCIGVGGLFDFWSGRVRRAPAWLRSLGHEWLYRLLAQPDKAARYLIGNPAFLLRIARSRQPMGKP